jgi:copper chaperone
MSTIKITGMTCQHCVKTVTETLEGIDGIENVSVNLDEGEATFDEKDSVDMTIVHEKIEDAGYEVG